MGSKFWKSGVPNLERQSFTFSYLSEGTPYEVFGPWVRRDKGPGFVASQRVASRRVVIWGGPGPGPGPWAWARPGPMVLGPARAHGPGPGQGPWAWARPGPMGLSLGPIFWKKLGQKIGEIMKFDLKMVYVISFAKKSI